MTEMIFVIGGNASGKSYFINQHFPEKIYHRMNIYDYQTKLLDEAGSVPMQEHIRLLHRAQGMILEDALELLKNGENVVMEHTLLKAKRRIAYLDKIKACTDAVISVYAMIPSETVWKERCAQRGLERPASPPDELEFPNPAEGFDKIYEVTENGIRERWDDAIPGLAENSRKELEEEQKQFALEQEQKERHNQLLESMKTRKFWHYCEVCGKKAFLTADEAHRLGWDYPPKIGFFGMLSPRTCPGCPMQETLYWKVQQQEIPLVIKHLLSPEERITWERIRKEPESLLEEEI